MAEMQTNAVQNSKRAGVARSKKLSTRVDLTPMVDLGFLLITFFIFTTALSKPTAMGLKLPAAGPPTNVANSTTLTLIPTDNNEIYYFHGQLTEALQDGLFGKTGFQPAGGIGDLLREKRKQLTAMDKVKDFSVLVYPDKSASYKNIVDLMDELVINAVPVQCLADDPATIEKLKISLMNHQ